jgi:heptosyltransferase-1
MACLQIIRRRFPGCSITWFADRKFADILDYNPDLAGIVKVDLKGLKKSFSFGKLAHEYRQVAGQREFDLAIDLHGMLKSALIARKVGRVTCGFHRSVAKEPLTSLLYDKTFAPDAGLKPAYRYVTLAAQALGIQVEEQELLDRQPYLFFSPEDARATADFFAGNRKNIILVPGTSLDEKTYPVDKFVTIADSLRENILVCHGNDQELRAATYIAERSSCVTVLPRMDLNQLKAAISRADLVIGGDTGPTHIAWANNVPSITLFGPTPPCISATAVNRIVVGEAMRDIAETVILTHAEELLSMPRLTN